MRFGDWLDDWLDYGWPPGVLGSAIYRWWQRRRHKESHD